MPALDRETADEAWERMQERAVNNLRVSEQAAGLPPLEGELLEVMQAGIALGIAAAAEHYREHPEHVPSDE